MTLECPKCKKVLAETVPGALLYRSRGITLLMLGEVRVSCRCGWVLRYNASNNTEIEGHRADDRVPFPFEGQDER